MFNVLFYHHFSTFNYAYCQVLINKIFTQKAAVLVDLQMKKRVSLFVQS